MATRLPEEETRSARKQRAILEAATSVFLQKGYLGASMDEVAARAGVSKQTVYKHFSGKEGLFNEIVLGTTDRVSEALLDAAAGPVAGEDEPAEELRALVRGLAASILQPDVMQVRRMIVAEAARFPELGRIWYDRGFERGLDALAGSLARLAERGYLRLDDPRTAANHLAGLVLWVPVNRAMFCGENDGFTEAELHRFAADALPVFLAAYRAP